MKIATTISVTVLLVLMGAAGAGASDDVKEVSNRVYARTLCSSLAEVVDAEGILVSEYNALVELDPTTFHDEAKRLADSFLDRVKTAQAVLKELQPPGGRKVAKLFNTYLTATVRKLDAAVRGLATADPESADFQRKVTTFEARLQSLSQTLPEPFRELHNQRLLAALRDEVTCTGIVEVG